MLILISPNVQTAENARRYVREAVSGLYDKTDSGTVTKADFP